MKFNKKTLASLGATLALALASSQASAGLLGVWSGWTMIASEDQSTDFLDPGWGGQAFDAENLLYKVDGSTLHIGLQTGFNLSDLPGGFAYQGRNYWAGDLALSFDNSPGTYEYAIDFGLVTRDYNSAIVSMAAGGRDAAGLYSNVTWGGQIAFPVSSPFAMSSGTFTRGLLANSMGDGVGADGRVSYYRMASFDMTGLNLGSNLSVHWTMSCGNDAINGRGTVSVPEPGTLALFGAGLLGLGLVRRRRVV